VGRWGVVNRGLVWVEGLYSVHQGDCDGGRVSVQKMWGVYYTRVLYSYMGWFFVTIVKPQLDGKAQDSR